MEDSPLSFCRSYSNTPHEIGHSQLSHLHKRRRFNGLVFIIVRVAFVGELTLYDSMANIHARGRDPRDRLGETDRGKATAVYSPFA